MNKTQYLNSKPACTKPVRFSAEIEGEGMELFLRGFLVACLLSALAICNLSIGTAHRDQPDDQAMVALAKPAAEPAAAPDANL